LFSVILLTHFKIYRYDSIYFGSVLQYRRTFLIPCNTSLKYSNFDTVCSNDFAHLWPVSRLLVFFIPGFTSRHYILLVIQQDDGEGEWIEVQRLQAAAVLTVHVPTRRAVYHDSVRYTSGVSALSPAATMHVSTEIGLAGEKCNNCPPKFLTRLSFHIS